MQSTQSPPLVPPITFADAQRTTQTVVITRNGQSYRMLCILELGTHGLVLVAFTELGQRLLTLEYGPQRYAIDVSPVVSPQFDAKRVLADLQLVYWPLNAFEESLRAGWSVSGSDTGDARRLVHNGELVATVRREADGTSCQRPALAIIRRSTRSQIDGVPATICMRLASCARSAREPSRFHRGMVAGDQSG
jgi:hypothetical protein